MVLYLEKRYPNALSSCSIKVLSAIRGILRPLFQFNNMLLLDLLAMLHFYLCVLVCESIGNTTITHCRPTTGTVRKRAGEHLQSQDIRKTIKVKQSALSLSSSSR